MADLPRGIYECTQVSSDKKTVTLTKKEDPTIADVIFSSFNLRDTVNTGFSGVLIPVGVGLAGGYVWGQSTFRKRLKMRHPDLDLHPSLNKFIVI